MTNKLKGISVKENQKKNVVDLCSHMLERGIHKNRATNNRRKNQKAKDIAGNMLEWHKEKGDLELHYD